ncbi:DNA primase DnaG [Promethearchaeum syntrophicum]|uniref:DNA primase DnaG n=1 Tax=Promethearchaeum syntrophicum TaxID=2594042 RepID=A0A5B9DED1_9ARCH|nr:DNA primase DnaG [Candidatus Prometheoarchaeum syntrophicum]QEE17452.1 DNA primase DnaG [Candidatus Prometheoarchaeum syntrophicum]
MTRGINESIDAASTSAKYNIVASFTVNGVVEVQDVVGALFGQTEGLFNDLELRELQKSGRIGRIVVNAESNNGKTIGEIIIPSSLDRTETAILAATMETVDRVGPCTAFFQLNEIKDLRESKLKRIEARAKELLKDWKSLSEDTPKISSKIKSALERESVIMWNGLPAGSDIDLAENVIIVEGRNDIQQLFKIGVKNTVAVNGTSVPKAIIDLTHHKECTAFLDGDRGGDMILNELLQVSKIQFYARAPRNLEVEELTPKDMVKCLQQKKPIEFLLKEKKNRDTRNDRFNSNHKSNGYRERIRTPKDRTRTYKDRRPDINRSLSKYSRDNKNYSSNRGSSRKISALEGLPKSTLNTYVKDLISSNQAIGLDEEYKEIYRTSNVKIFNELNEKLKTVVMDGVITQRFLDEAIKNKIEKVIAVNIKARLKFPEKTDIKLFYFKDFLTNNA